MFIDGEWIQTSERLEVRNPVNYEVVDNVYVSGAAETRQAIGAAKRALGPWSSRTADERAAILMRIAEALENNMEIMAKTITHEMGKPLALARAEAATAAKFFRWYAEEARRIYGDTIPASAANKRLTVIRQPVGVVGAIIPWNFPLSMGARKLGPALAAGCTVILKPSKEAPLASVELCRIMEQAGLPEGVVNLVVGDSSTIVNEFMVSKDVRKISFTGSTEIGKLLLRQSADTVKRVSMELGGHAPFIVFEDADIDAAVQGALLSKYASSGQQCICANRIYVHEGIYDAFAERFTDRVNRLVIGNGMRDGTDIGPLINAQALEKVHDQVQDAIAKGAAVLCGGEPWQGGDGYPGSFYKPTVLGDAGEDMKIAREETFGPVAPLFRFTSEEEVIRRANDTDYGLAAYFYTNDLSRMYRVSEQLEYGMVGVNDPFPNTVQAPFGGVKESGQGREGGQYGLHDYMEEKLISIVIKNS